MGFLAFLGGFVAIGLAICILVHVIKRKLRDFSRQAFGTPDIMKVLKESDMLEDTTPRSLNGCDALLLPQIRQDFPDFDPDLAKTYARNFLRERYGRFASFTIHNVVISKYLRSPAQKTVVFQSAVAYKKNDRLLQKRYELNYTYLLPDVTGSVAANCPNCGGALGMGVTVCSYCGSRVANPLGNNWEFTEIRET